MVTKYCICRTTDTAGFMIQCEQCEEWFHGRCVNITRKLAKNIEKYMCATCCRTYNLEIIYSGDPGVSKRKSKTDQALAAVKQEPPEEKRQQERKAPETALAPIPIPAPVVEQPPAKQTPTKSPKKAAAGRRKGPKAKSKAPTAVQCANPECTKAARQDESKYCSHACGYAFNKLRYFKFYVPQRDELKRNPSQGRNDRMMEIKSLLDERDKVLTLIKDLKEQEIELHATIKTIKSQAKQMYEERKKTQNDDSSSKSEAPEEILTGDNAKTYCYTCGVELVRSMILKHWLTCHKKHEGTFNLTATEKSRFPDVDEDPGIFCEVPDKKSNGFCRHLKTACPFHTHWAGEKEEVCACPLEINQKLEPNGNYCLELKKECQSHYHWDIFRAADLTQLRIHTFGRWENIQFRLRSLESQLNDTYGGIIGTMLHRTIDYQVKENTDKVDENSEELEVAVDV